MKKKTIQKLLRTFISDCEVKMRVIHDDNFCFKSYFVTVRTKCCFPLHGISEFCKFMKDEYDLDCCDFHFDLGCSHFCFEMF